MNFYDIIFYIFAVLTIGSAGMVVFSKNIVYSAFSLMVTFFSVAGIYVMLNADFIAITQLLIYVGGILILMIFGVMLTTNVTNVELNTQTLKGSACYSSSCNYFRSACKYSCYHQMENK